MLMDIGIVVGVIIFLFVAFEIYRYLKGHPAQATAFEARLSALEDIAIKEGKLLVADVKAFWDKETAPSVVKPPAVAAPVQTGEPVAVGPVVAPIAQAPVTPAAQPGITISGTPSQISDVIRGMLGGSAAPATTQPPAAPVIQPPVGAAISPTVIYYNHNTFVNTGAYTTEPLGSGPNSVTLTYTGDQIGDNKEPTQAWMSENGSAWLGPYMAQAEAVFPLTGAAGTVSSLSFRFDTNGRMIGQLRKF